nr:methionine gamma-lyase-like [Ipomoea batatas]
MICRSHDGLLVHHEHPWTVVGVHESLMMSGWDILVDIEEAMAGSGGLGGGVHPAEDFIQRLKPLAQLHHLSPQNRILSLHIHEIPRRGADLAQDLSVLLLQRRGLSHQLVQVLLLPHPRPARRLPVRLHPLPLPLVHQHLQILLRPRVLKEDNGERLNKMGPAYERGTDHKTGTEDFTKNRRHESQTSKTQCAASIIDFNSLVQGDQTQTNSRSFFLTNKLKTKKSEHRSEKEKRFEEKKKSGRKKQSSEQRPDHDYVIFCCHFNPTILNVSSLMVTMEGTEAAYYTASRILEISSVMFQLHSSSDHVVAACTLYPLCSPFSSPSVNAIQAPKKSLMNSAGSPML